MRYLSVAEVIVLHEAIVAASGEPPTIRDRGLLESAVGLPAQSFDGEDLYPELLHKAAALAVALNKNQAFLNGNKRVAHAAMETMLVLNGFEIRAAVDDAERMSLAVAAGTADRTALAAWLEQHATPFSFDQPAPGTREPMP
jgi:death-on-curing protein